MNAEQKAKAEQRERKREAKRAERQDWTAPEHSRDAGAMRRVRGSLVLDGRPEIMRPRGEPRTIL